MSDEQHPDLALLQRSQRAISAWLERSVSAPTSSLTGGGAINYAEARISELHENRPALLMPSATYALWVALRALGIRPGDEVLIPQYDWGSNLAVVLALRATPIPVPVDPTTLTIDPAIAESRRTARTRAVIATHLFGVAADVPELRRVLPGLQVVEDCAQAFGSTLDGHPVGVLGDAAIFSFGPGKRIDVGELGALVLGDQEMRTRALQLSAHPVRQQLNGIGLPELASMSIRPHPLAAVQLVAALDEDDSDQVIQERHMLAKRLLAATGPVLPGAEGRRGIAARFIAMIAERLTPHELPPSTQISYGEVQDIAALSSGTPRCQRIAFIKEAETLDLQQQPGRSHDHAADDGRQLVGDPDLP